MSNMQRIISAAGVAGLIAGGAQAQFNLQITELWPGSNPGANLTEDWIEVTNFGDSAWVAATHGNLYYDDDSLNPAVADLMSGIDSIAPGESVVYVHGGLAGATEWFNVWSPSVTVPQIGFHDGSGLGGGGDAAGIFLDSDNDGILSIADLLDSAAYPFADDDGGQSWDVLLNAFSTVGNASGAVATTAVNDIGQPAIGSPGAVPEPGSIALLGLGGLALMARRRRNA